MSLFHELNDEAVTLILVTHETEIAEQAKRIIRMKDGRIVQDQAVISC